MKFTISHKRAISGNDIKVVVEREGQQVISQVETRLDVAPLGNDQLNPPSVIYTRQFGQAGTAGPGQEHTLIVTAYDEERNPQSATYKWRDER